jgi:hypothetical protein
LAVLTIFGVKNAKEWLLFAVIEAEKQLGSDTGALKLRVVYDQFLEKFPVLRMWVSFDLFSKMVDEALNKMQDLAESKGAINEYIQSK